MKIKISSYLLTSILTGLFSLSVNAQDAKSSKGFQLDYSIGFGTNPPRTIPSEYVEGEIASLTNLSTTAYTVGNFISSLSPAYLFSPLGALSPNKFSGILYFTSGITEESAVTGIRLYKLTLDYQRYTVTLKRVALENCRVPSPRKTLSFSENSCLGYIINEESGYPSRSKIEVRVPANLENGLYLMAANKNIKSFSTGEALNSAWAIPFKIYSSNNESEEVQVEP